MPKLKIDNHEIEVESGTSILQAAEQLGIEIPRFCYHDRLSVPANCRMCLVEMKGAPKPVASCAMAAGDNMEIFTNTEQVHKARNGVMEMLLINHPLDCPICDQGGECDLQDQSMAYGFDRSRYQETKRSVPNENLGPIIKTIMTRCIQCTRCVRFGEEIAGVEELGLLNRGENAAIGTFVESAVTTELSGNMVDVCPVGALTNKPYAYNARPWELTKTPSIDVMDAVGSNIRVDSKGNKVMRIQPRLHEDINEEWINDRTRHACDGLSNNRLDRPYIRVNGQLQEASWAEAFGLITDSLKGLKPPQISGITGDLCAVEDMVVLKDFMSLLGVESVNGLNNDISLDTTHRGNYLFNTGIAALEKADAILLIGTNPRYEATMINTRIRKNWVKNRVPVAYVGPEVDLTYPYEWLGQDTSALDTVATAKHAFGKLLKKAKKPVIILGAAACRGDHGKALHQATIQMAQNLGVIRDDWNGFNMLHIDAAQVGALDLGLVKQNDYRKTKCAYFMGVDSPVIEKMPRDCFIICQSHHGNNVTERADVILPGAAYTEKDGIYINTEGRVQLGKKAVFPPGNAKEDWTILRALSEHMGKPLPYNSLVELRQRILSEWDHMATIDHIGPELVDTEQNIQMLRAPVRFKPAIENFYLTNSVTRASQTMQDCAAELWPKAQTKASTFKELRERAA